MRVEIPECRRCFICVPLRYGIITFGYLNLLFSLLAISVEMAWMIDRRNGTVELASETYATYKGVSLFSQVWVILVLYILEVVFNIVLLVGAHKRRLKLIRIYYYYGITTLLASCVTFLVVETRYTVYYMDVIGLAITFLCLGSQAYLLLLIRTEMMKRRYEEGDTHTEFINNVMSHHPPNWREQEVL